MDFHNFVFEAFLPGIVGTTGCITFLILVRALGKRIAGSGARPALPASPSREDAERWERLEQSIDAMAIEVERISEAQRFTVKLLAGRSTGSTDGVQPSSPARAAQ